MIRINLLPLGKRPVEERIRKEITVFFLLIFFSLSVMVYFHIDHTRTIKQITVKKRLWIVKFAATKIGRDSSKSFKKSIRCWNRS